MSNRHNHAPTRSVIIPQNEDWPLRGILDSHGIFSSTDAAGRIVDVSTGFCQISGYSREELLGQSHRLINSGVHPQEFWKEMWETILSGKSWRREICNRRKDGCLYWVDSTIVPQLDPSGKLQRVLSLRFDITRLKLAEENSEHIKKRLDDKCLELQSIIDAIPAFIYYKDDQNTILDLNQRAAQEIGKSPEEIRGHKTEEYFPAEDSAAYLQDDLDVVGSGKPKLGIVEEHKISGRENVHIKTDKIPLRGPTGKFDRLVAIATDITELTQTRRDLEDLRKRLERATNGASDGLWEWEPATDEIWYSDQFKRLLGLTPETFDRLEPNLSAFSDRLHPLDRERTFAAIEAHLLHNEPYVAKYRLRLEGGDYRWFRARGLATRSEDGTPTLMSGSITDIHDEHKAQSRLDLATQAAKIGLWDWDLSANEIFHNIVVAQMLGYRGDELDHQSSTKESLIHPDDLESARQAWASHLEGKTCLYSHEHRVRRSGGDWLWIRDTGEVVEHSADGSPKRMIGVVVDIDKIKKAGEILEIAKKEAEASSQSKSEFLANMSHELRTPMTAILGYADLLSCDDESLQDPAQVRDAIDMIQGNAHHLLTIINDILDMSKIEAGRLSIEWMESDPATIANEVITLLHARAEAKEISLSASIDSPIPRSIRTDPTRLRQILLNIAGNAIKFTEAGSVTLHMRYDPNTETMRFRVVDTGIGMSEEQRDAIAKFDAFTQADSSTTRKFGGTGLGLRISNILAQMLGGSLSIESEQGKGTTATVAMTTGPMTALDPPQQVSVRIMNSAPNPEKKAPKFDEKSLSGIKILLAEDGTVNQKLISLLLRKSGAQVSIAANGLIAAEALENALADELPHLVLMDMQMPELDGYGATSRLRENGITLPIIALTANAMDGDREKCLDAGCDDFLSKPIDRVKMIEVCAYWSKEGRSTKCPTP